MCPQILSVNKKKKKKEDVLAHFSVQHLYQSHHRHVQNIHFKIIPCHRFLSIPV